MVLLDSIMKNYVILITVFLFSNNLFSQNNFENLDVFNLQYVQDPQISPDGSKIVYVRTKMDIMKDGRSSSLWIINTDGSNNFLKSISLSILLLFFLDLYIILNLFEFFIFLKFISLILSIIKKYLFLRINI